MPQSPTLAGLALPFLLALLLKRQALELPRVLGMPTRLSGPLRVTETFLQLGRLLMQLDRSGVRRQFPALGQRSSLTSAGRTLMLADLLGPTRCLTRSLEDATNLLNGLHSQVPRRSGAWSSAFSFPRMAVLPFWPSRSIELPDRLQHGGSQPLRQPACCRRPWAWQGRQGLACSRGGRSSMTVLKEGRRRGPNAEPPVRSFGNARTCAADGCATRLSRYNPAPCCYLHEVGPGTEDSPGPPRAGVAAGADHGRRSSCGLSAISSTSCWSLAGCTARPARS